MPISNVTDAGDTLPYGMLQHVASGVSGAVPANDYGAYDLLVFVVHSMRGLSQGVVWAMDTDCT